MVQSPCINLCQLDPATGECRGCRRTLEEITAWSRTGDQGRLAILAAVAKRRAASSRLSNHDNHSPKETLMETQEEQYLCVGICMADPDSGYCLGCGRPPMESPDIVSEVVKPVYGNTPKNTDPDSPA